MSGTSLEGYDISYLHFCETGTSFCVSSLSPSHKALKYKVFIHITVSSKDYVRNSC